MLLVIMVDIHDLFKIKYEIDCFYKTGIVSFVANQLGIF